jgi:hypothetical protein
VYRPVQLTLNRPQYAQKMDRELYGHHTQPRGNA